MKDNFITKIKKLFGYYTKNQLVDVFTPSKSALLTFVERPELQKQIEKSLVIPGQQIIIYGHSGGGKTTIVQKILENKGIEYIVSNCMSETTFNQLLLDAFDKLNIYFTSSVEEKEGSKLSGGHKATILNTETNIGGELSEEHTEKQERILPPQLTAQRLTDILGH